MMPLSHFKAALGTALLLVCLIGVALLGLPQLVVHASANTASITLSPNSGPPTTRVTVQGTGFGPNEQAVITLDNNPVGKGKTDKQGNFTTKIIIPKNYGPGPAPVQATGQSSGLTAQATFTINTDWPSYGFDQQNTRYNPYENVLNPSDASLLVQKWSYNEGKRLANSTALVNGVLYLSGQVLYAVDAQNGKLIWKTKLSVYATSVVNGVVYGGAKDGNVYAVDAQTGKVIWSYKTGVVSLVSPPNVVNGVVYVGGDGMYALNAQTGSLIWKHPSNYVTGSPAVANGIVYFGTDVGIIDGLDAQTGVLIWSYVAGGPVDSSAAVANGVVYIGSSDNNVYALDAQTGALKWKYTTGWLVASSPAVANGIVYIGSFDDYLYALNAQTGALIWKYNTGYIIYYSSPVVANGVVYIGASSIDNKQLSVAVLDAQKGTLLWSYNSPGYSTGEPIVANGFFYIGIDKAMYAFSLPGLKS